MGNFNKAKGDSLTAEEWNSLGGEIERLDRRIDETSIQFPTSEEGKKKYLRGDKTWGNPQVPTMSVNPNVDIVPASEASVEIEEQTENDVKFKFSLPQGKEGKVYVPNVDNEGDLTWELQDNPPEIETPINIKGPQGEQGTGLKTSHNKDGKTTTVTITTNEEIPQEVDNFQINDGNDGNDGHNPCLGVFVDESSLPTTDVREGDYAYASVTDSTTQTAASHIFRYDGSEWQDNGEGSPDNQTAFDGGNGPAVGNMKIDDTQLDNPTNNALALAKDIPTLVKKVYSEGENPPDLYISDEEGNALVEVSDGHIKTKNFDSRNVQNVTMEVVGSTLKITI